ncbi:hypothetical protein B0181_10575 [Moraxella caviae]|uniref:Uncharacterized protein conserved in bacteria n=1 Tax=Moraxella caviae TaxID=34060 RepID=A0A1S9ZUU7_9GAMM|nr:DUF2184 domain-containing protein [Moraxella caviae]OOR87286.1 hypothetical protein B0181_10575 [Moraxella caviae]STZ14048.1 Uncharacterized protein conserved in bacteria [Moraxella caviae]
MPQFNDNQLNSMLNFVASQKTHVEKTAYETKFPEIVYHKLIPVDQSAPAWTQTITSLTSEELGEAGWINANADDMQTVELKFGASQKPIHEAGVGYTYGYAEVQQAMAFGRNLTAEKAVVARRAYERFVERVAMVGDKTKGLQGLVTHDGVTTLSATKSWQTATQEEVLSDINAMLSATAEDTHYTLMADTLLLPPKAFEILASRPLANNTGLTLLEYVKNYNAYTAQTGKPLDIRAIGHLKTAGAGSLTRAIAYTKDPSVLKLHIPMAQTFLPVHRTGLMNFSVGSMFRLGGTDIRQPNAIRYMDGV